MRLIYVAGIVVTACCAAIAVVLWPTTEYALDASCRPRGFIPELRAEFNSNSFWRNQERALLARIQKDEQYFRLRAASPRMLEQITGPARRLLDSTYEKYPQLRPKPEAVLRRLADSIELAGAMAIADSVIAVSYLQLSACRPRVAALAAQGDASR